MLGNVPALVPNNVRMRVAAALPAAGADWESDWIPCRNFMWATFYLHYDRAVAAAVGEVTFHLEFRIARYAGTYPMSAYAVGAVVAGADTASLIQREVASYQATGADAEGFVWGPIALAGTVEDLRFVANETGDVDNPGDFGVDVQFSVGMQR